ncbi:hypothetical protein [Nocardia huaxiensis]|uniref:hypothetical protein n=1 Tax=Nocardia huaxiensis TaxID=2755382 RepID=UPI001FD161B2|nr:hypothetical protein [Nocardia huaxiensis]
MTIDPDQATEPETTGATTDSEEETSKPAARPSRPAPPARSVAVPLTTLAWSAALALAVIVSLTLTGFLVSARSDLAAHETTARDQAHAEQVATDYAVGASTVNFTEFNTWVTRLKSNTTPALSTKFEASAPKLQDLLTPLKWTSTGTPISAKVMSESNGAYKVNVFVNVSSTNAQNPEGAQTTVTYNVTVDRNADWKVTDVGGMDGALPLK